MKNMKIEKLKSGSYRIRKMYKGVAYSVVTDYKPTQREAIKLMDQEMDKTQNKKIRMSFEEASSRYIESRSNVISPSTIRGYQSIVRNLSDKFKRLIITDITNLDVQTEINTYSATHSPKTTSNACGYITAVLGMYCPNLILKIKLPQKIKKDPYIPTDNDIKKILDAAYGTQYYIPLILATFGLRRSEICALTIDDLDGNILTINKAKISDDHGEWHIKTTKTPESTRKLYIPDSIADQIRDQGYIYNGHPNSIICFLSRTEKALGMKHFSLHKFRHYYASTASSLGVPDAYIMQAGGWKTDHVLKSVYRHAQEGRTEEMQQCTARYLQNVIL